MLVKFQYTDHSEWEGMPEQAHTSPDKGIIRMVVTDDHGYVLNFVYQDIYYLYEKDGGWLFGACTPWREFIIYPGVAGCDGKERPLAMVDGAVIRYGERVSQEEALAFGLIQTIDQKILHDKRRIKTCQECSE